MRTSEHIFKCSFHSPFDLLATQSIPTTNEQMMISRLCTFACKQILHKRIKRVVRGGGGSRSCFTENKTVLSYFTKNKIGISCFTEKKENIFLKTKVTYRFILKKLRPKQRLVCCFHYPSTSCSERCKKETEFCIYITNGTIFHHCKIMRVCRRSRHRIPGS